MKEIERKSILVRVSAWLELARVRVIGSQLTVKYFHSMIQYFTFAVVNGWPQQKLNSGDCTFKRLGQWFQDKNN